MRGFFVRSIAILLGCFFSHLASATVIGGNVTTGGVGATFHKLTVPLSNPLGAPNSVGNNTFQDNNLYAFDENQNIVLAAPLMVDVVASGPLTLAVGTTVASHYVFFDPGPTTSIDGTVDFDSEVLAIMTSTGKLAASDFLANTGVNYLNPTLRGLEVGDMVTINGPKQIRFHTSASTPGDYVRVLTKFSPQALVLAPDTASLLLLGLVGLMLLRRTRSLG